MRPPSRVVWWTFALLGLGGCGEPPRAPDLAARLPTAARTVVVADLAAARRALDLPFDADPRGTRRLRRVAAAAIPGRATPPPLGRALDLGRVSAAATGGATTLVATDQPFAELRGPLRRAGYRERRGVLVGPGRAIAESGDVVVIAPDQRRARAVLGARAAADDPRLQLLRAVGGEAATIVIRRRATFFTAVATGQDVASGTTRRVRARGPRPGG